MSPKGNEASSPFGAPRDAITFEIGLGKSLTNPAMTSTVREQRVNRGKGKA